MSNRPVIVWTKLLGSSSENQANALTTGLDGSIYVGGYTSGALDGQTYSGSKDAFLTKYSADGTKAWTKLLGTSKEDRATALTTGLDGSIYVSGQTDDALDGQTYSGAQDPFLTKFSADGTKAWTKLLGSSNSDRATALTTGLDGSIYVSGWTNGALDGQTNNGIGDAFLTKYNPDGTKVWTKLLGSSSAEQANALTTGLDGSIYVSGWTHGALDGQTYSGSGDAFLTKYNPDGSKVWTKLLGSSSDDLANALTTGLDGSIYVSGWTNGALDGQTNSGGWDVFLTKFQEVGTATYALSAGSSSYNEGSTATFALTTTNVASGTSVPYTLSGISTEDVLGNLLSGNAVVNSSGVATISVTLLSDLLTEGAETLTVAAGGTSVSTLVNDTSKDITPTYLFFTNNSTANEGDTINFELRTSGVSAGTEIPYSISIQQAVGVAYSDPSKDVMGGILFGKVTINANGLGVISVGLTNDNQTEGYENLSISAAGATSQIRISDTSLTLPTASTRTVNEGQSFTVYLSNSSYFPGAALTVKATGTGITSNDLGSLITYVVINSNSVATATFNVIAVKLSEGTETVLIQFSNGDQLLSSPISIEILDTSQSATTYSLTPGSSSVNEGSTATFTLSTTNVAAGTSVLYTLSGVSAADVTGGALSGNAVVDSSGSATISVALVNDSLTEGSETLTVTAGGATASCGGLARGH